MKDKTIQLVAGAFLAATTVAAAVSLAFPAPWSPLGHS